MDRSKQLDLLLYFSYIVFFISLVCCFRAISSISIGMLLITGLLKNKVDTGSWLSMNLKNSFPAACCLYYLLDAAGLLLSTRFNETGAHLLMKTAMIFVPLALCCCNWLNNEVRRNLMAFYTWILAAMLFYCLLAASNKYWFINQDAEVFFYHKLVAPFRQHAVQVSIYTFAALIYLVENARKAVYTFNKPVHLLLIFYFTCFTLLLSSKLVIASLAICFIYYFFLALRSRLNTRILIFSSLFTGLAMIILVLSTQNRISKRFNEIRSGDISLIKQQSFNPGIYFNGIQFRLLEWRFVKEILTEQDAWLTGVSDKAQLLLDKKYTSTNMYIGDGTSADQGYLGYNTHNQFLESLLRSGIPGLLVFILICFAMIRLAIIKKSRELTIMIMILLAYCFNESVLETQYGITLFTFFPLFIYYGSKQGYPAGNNQGPRKSSN